MNARLSLRLLRKPATPHPYQTTGDVSSKSMLKDASWITDERQILPWLRGCWRIAGCLQQIRDGGKE